MTVPADAVQVELIVPFHHVDSLEVVWHGHYVKYLELARQELLRRRGLDVPELKRLGYAMMIAETHLRHVFPLSYGDRVRVSAWNSEVAFKIVTEYEIFNVTAGRRAATAQTVLVTVDTAGALQIGTPRPILERLG